MPIDREDAIELLLQLRMLPIQEGDAVLGHYKAEGYEDGFILSYHKPFISESIDETIDLAGDAFNLDGLMALLSDTYVFESSEMRLDSRAQIEKLKNELIIASYKDNKTMHYLQYNPQPGIKQVIMNLSNLEIVISAVDDDNAGFVISPEDEGRYEKVMLTNVEAMVIDDRLFWVQKDHGQLMNISVKGSSDKLVELCKTINGSYEFDYVKTKQIEVNKDYKTQILQRQENVYERREYLWEYISKELVLPEGQGVLGHIKIPGFDVEVFADYLDLFHPDYPDAIIGIVGDLYNIETALAAIPSKYIFEKAVVIPEYKPQAADLEGALIEKANKDEAPIHTIFYDLNYDSMSTIIVYEDAFTIEFGHINTGPQEDTMANTILSDQCKSMRKRGSF